MRRMVANSTCADQLKNIELKIIFYKCLLYTERDKLAATLCSHINRNICHRCEKLSKIK